MGVDTSVAPMQTGATVAAVPRQPTTNIGRRRASAQAEGGVAYETRRAEIITAAAKVFLAKGFGSTTFKDIGEELGIDRATLYYYFSSKEELFQTATGAAVARNTEAAEAVAASSSTPAEKLHRILALVLDSYTNTDYPYMYIFLQEDLTRVAGKGSERWAAEVRALSRRYEAAVTRIVQEGIDLGEFSADVPPAMVTRALIGMTNWTQRWFRPSGPLDANEVAELFGHLVLRGLER